MNEHGNTPLHYACFWGYHHIAEDLVNSGALVSIVNKSGDMPLDKCKGALAKRLHGNVVSWRDLWYYIPSLDLAIENGQDLKKIAFKDQSWMGMKTRTRRIHFQFDSNIHINVSR